MKTAKTPLCKPREKYLTAFFIAFVCAAALFVPYMIYDKGYFLFYGDFNVQQVPFYKLAHEAVRSGSINWSFGTDLGTNFIGSYTFYLLGSPFFWLTLPFPTEFVPHLIGPLLILKFSFASLTCYAFLSRFVKNKDFAVLGGVLYAFSGFSVYNIFFNHFHEAIVYFPLLLLSLELLVKDNRRGVFAFVVFLCALSNYYFFFGMVVYTLIYFVLRCLSPDWKMTFKKFLVVALEAVIGVVMSSVLLLPSVLMITQNSRVGSFITGWNGLLYSKYQRYGYIFQSFFFPPDLPARPVFFPEADAKWASVAGWLPVFGMSGVIAYMMAKKGTWLKRIIIISAVFAFIPVLNASFSAFNYAYYARWFYMPVLMMVLITAKSLEDPEIDWRRGWVWSFFITLAIALAIGLFPKGQYSDGSFTGFGLFSEQYKDRFYMSCGIALASSLITGILLVLRNKSVRRFTVMALLCVCIISTGYSSLFVALGKQSSYDTRDFIVPNLIQNGRSMQLEGKNIDEIDDCRFDVYKGMDNIAMYLGVSSINAFHSVVSKSIFDYYDFVGVERVVGSRPDADDKNYAIRGLLSVKYLLDYNKDSNKFADEYNLTKMPGYTLYDTQNDFDIYKNDYYIPYGFTYDHYVTKSYCEKLENSERQLMMLRAMVIDDEDVDKFSDVLTDIRSNDEKSEAWYKSNPSSSGSSADSGDTPSDTAMSDASVISDSSSDSSALSDGSTEPPASDSSDPSPADSSSGSSSSESGSEISGESPENESSDSDSSSDSEQVDPYINYKFKSNIRLYKLDCNERAQTSCLTFKTDKKGFEAVTTLSRDNYVFFSIPYDSGWTATVDGEPAEIVKANVGFMAVRVKGDGQVHTIRFDYTVPGLFKGVVVSGFSLLALIVYTAIASAIVKKKKESAFSSGTDVFSGEDLYKAQHFSAGENHPVSRQKNTGIPGAPDNSGGIRPTSYLEQFGYVHNSDNSGEYTNGHLSDETDIRNNAPSKNHFVRSQDIQNENAANGDKSDIFGSSFKNAENANPHEPKTDESFDKIVNNQGVITGGFTLKSDFETENNEKPDEDNTKSSRNPFSDNEN